MWKMDLYIAALVGTLSCLVFIVYFVVKNKTINSTSVSLAVWVIFSLVMLFIEPLIFSPTNDVQLNRIIWYGGFAALDVAAILIINFIHKKNNIELSVQSLIICLSFFLLLLLQVSRYIDKQLLGMDLLGNIYSEGIIKLNVLTWAFVVCVVVINQAKKNKRNIK